MLRMFFLFCFFLFCVEAFRKNVRDVKEFLVTLDKYKVQGNRIRCGSNTCFLFLLVDAQSSVLAGWAIAAPRYLQLATEQRCRAWLVFVAFDHTRYQSQLSTSPKSLIGGVYRSA
jgi:hypothetical protein